MIVTDLSSDVIMTDSPTERHQSNLAGPVLAASFYRSRAVCSPENLFNYSWRQRHV